MLPLNLNLLPEMEDLLKKRWVRQLIIINSILVVFFPIFILFIEKRIKWVNIESLIIGLGIFLVFCLLGFASSHMFRKKTDGVIIKILKSLILPLGLLTVPLLVFIALLIDKWLIGY